MSIAPELVGKSIEELTALVNGRLAAMDTLAAKAAATPERVDKLVRALHRTLAAKARELAKQQHRDPAVLAEAMSSAYQASISGGPPYPPQQAAFYAGFQHALAGKTASTLAGDNLADQQRGYKDAKAWMKTEQGAAFYEGRPVNKLVNTGIDLRRHWEALREQMKAGESDMAKAWRQIERATARADLFAPLVPEAATPGFKVYAQAVRSGTATFNAWLDHLDWTGEAYFRSRYSDSKPNPQLIQEGSRYPRWLDEAGRARFQDDAAYRVQVLQDLAGQYLTNVREFWSFLEGKSSVKEASDALRARHFEGTPLRMKASSKPLAFYGKGNDTARVWDGRLDELERLAESRWLADLVKNEATVALPTRADALIPPRLDRVTREGVTDWRKGENVTPARFKERFGFADVGFGKWVGSRQDQDHLNYAYDALNDLAKHFGIEPKNVGFGGKLHFTIGALGHGKHAAHYGPAQPHPNGGTVQVINLTNTQGDGAVYHEWIHALDHNLFGATFSKNERNQHPVRQSLLDYLKVGTRTPEDVEQRAIDFLFGGWYFKGDKRADKVDTAVRGVRGGLRKTSAYKTNADALGKDYWGNDQELIARASEAWAADTLGGTNTYLVNPAWVGDGAVTKDKGYRGTPYPTGDERKLFNQVYGALAKAVKWVDGKPTVTVADFEAALPDEVTAWKRRRAELSDRTNMQAFYDEQVEKRSAAEAEKQAAKAAEAQAEQQRLDELAAQKLADLQPPVVDAPPPSATAGPLADNDLAAIFDEAAAELREGQQEQPNAPPPGARTVVVVDKPPPGGWTAADKVPRKDDSAGKLIAEAAKQGVTGINEALTGLAALFGGSPGRLNSFGAGFDEATYQRAKPHFKAALVAFQAAGKSLKDLFKLLIQQFGDGVKEYAIRFAKDEALTAQLAAAPQVSASSQVADQVRASLEAGRAFDWRALFAWSDAAWGGTQAEGKYTVKDAYDAMEAGMNRYLMAMQGRAFNPDSDAQGAALTLAAVQRATNLLPTQTKRTAEQDEFQQFSTVPPLAFVANWVSGVGPGDVVLEPSAGIGGLAVFAHNAGAKLVLNELSSRRAAVLQEVFPSARVFHENAEQIDNVLPDDVRPTVVVMNPPFSASAGRMQGARDTAIGARHVTQALDRLPDGGRLVAIVGEGMAMDKPAFAGFWRDMRAKYDVRAVVPIDGKGYAKYGTTFDSVLLVIDKRAPSGRDVVTTRVEAYTDLVPLLAGIRNDRPASTLPASNRDGAERDAAESARRDAAARGEGADRGPGAGEPAGLDGAEPLQQPDGGRDGAGRGGAGGGGRSKGRVRQPGGRPDAAGADAAGSGAGAGQPDGGPAGQPQSGVTVESGDAATAALTDSVFEQYLPQRLRVPGAKPHPGALVQSAAMASVQPPATTYTPNLPTEVISEGKLSIAQIEAVVYAGQAHQQLLEQTVGTKAKGKVSPDAKYRRGFFIGDGTGVGKGREIAGIILDNLRQGRKRAVWVSEKQGLMTDAKRDFGGIGGDANLIFNQNETKAEGAIPARDGILFTTYSTMRSGAQSQGTGKKVTQAQLDKAFKPGAQVVVGVPWGVSDRVTVTLEKWDAKKGDLYVTDPRGRTGKRATFAQVISIDGQPINMMDPDDVRAVIERMAAGKTKEAGQSRFDQLATWLGDDFDGVIVFDEAHSAGNALTIKGERGMSKPSAQALAVVDLQNRLPNARVVYVSATGATKVENLGYATRLGLWGDGTSFPSVESFVSQMEAGGLATMELVARDMKQMGAYMARSLSFDGVTYSRVEHQLSETQRAIYDRLAEGWQVTLQNFMQALEATGVTEGGKTKNGPALAAAKSAYWGAQQRFFNQIITSMQMPSVIDAVEADLAGGRAVVMQLVNTNEASQDRALKERKEAGEESLEDLDLTPRDQLLQMVEKSFPVTQYEEYTDEDGNTRTRPVLDANGQPVVNRRAVAMRDALLKDLKEIAVPQGPLEIVLGHFGPDAVAEITGRTQRVVNRADEQGNVKATLEARSAAKARADADAFMADKKRILIFSDAGGTGYSFQSDLTKANQRQRSHYLIQPGWRADKAVQGFGRTHRTNQANAPEYRLASTDIPAHKRFLSSIARRLDQLGALTKGQRDTANQGLFSEKDNLESKYAQAAVRQLLDDTRGGRIAGLDFGDLLRQLGLDNIVDPRTNTIAEDKYPPMSQFLNRMLSLKLATQQTVFDAFVERMEDAIDQAAQRGTLETGMQTIRALESRVVRDEKVYADPRTGAETRYVELQLTLPTQFHQPPDELQRARAEWLVNGKSGKVWARIKSGSATLKDGSIVDRFRLLGTGGMQVKDATEFNEGAYRKIGEAEALDLWAKENAARPATYNRPAHMIVGALLPIWDRIKTDGVMEVARTQTADGQRLLGRVIREKDVADVLKRLNVDSGLSKLAPTDVLARILRGEVGELANGWKLERARVSDDLRVEIKGRLYGAVTAELERLGMIHERISWNDRYFVPTGKPEALAALLKNRPLVSLAKPGDEAGAAFSRGGAPGQRSAADVQAIADRIAARWANAPQIVVVESMADARVPASVRSENARQESKGATGAPEGFYADGKVFLVAPQIGSDADVQRVLFHETLGHYGLRGTYGKALADILDGVATFRAQDVRAKAQRYGLDPDSARDRRIAAEEVLADLAQTQPELGFVRRALAAIRTFLRDLGLRLRMTDDELVRNYLLPARAFVERGHGFAETAPGVQRFSRASAPDSPEFRRWFGDSKVVDADGKPLVVYHGSASPDIRRFRPGVDGAGWFAKNPELASEFALEGGGGTDGDTVYPVYLSIKNPLDVRDGNYPPGVAEALRGSDRPAAEVLPAFGYDGIIADEWGGKEGEAGTTYLAFRPEQIKSATGNRGTFDANNHDIRFSRTHDVIERAKQLELVGYRMGDLFDADGKLSWWHKTVGTPHNLAQRSAPFRRVYDSVRGFIDDTSFYATEAADLAPSILPKLEGWRDLVPKWAGGTKGPLDAADAAAIRAPIFEGTLSWVRDERGRAVRADEFERRANAMTAEGKAQDMLRRGLLTEQVLKMWQGMPIEQFEAAVNTRYSAKVLKPGVVFKPDELRSLFKLTPEQVRLYQEARASIDKSLTNLTIADMVRYAGEDAAPVRERALAATSARDAATILRDHLFAMAEADPDRADVLNDTANTIASKGEVANDLIERGYAPLMRFGQFTLDVVDEAGERVYFGLFETTRERARMARQMRENFPQATIRTGTTSQEEYRMFQGVSPETVELFGDLLGLEAQGARGADLAFQEYLKRAKATRSAMKRLIHRKGIAGFNEDVGRVLAGFVYSNARQTSSNLHRGEMEDSVEAIPQQQGQLKDAAVQLVDYVRNPREEAQALRGLLFAQYLGGSIASAMVNAMQPVQVTFPYLAQHTSIANAARQMARATRDALKGRTGDAALDAALHVAAEKGIVSPQEVHQLIGQAAGKATLRTGDGTKLGNALATGSNALSRLQIAWGKVFGVAEQFNRRATFIAAYRVAVERGMADPAAFAEQAVNDTQIVYSKANRPAWARGAVGSVLFTFKTYSINYVELIHRMWKSGPEGRKAALLALSVLAFMSGWSGLPGSDDLDDLIDGLLQRMGYNFQGRAKRQQFFAETLGLGNDAAQFIEHGFSSLPGIPIDVSGRFGLGNLAPGSGLFTKKQNYGRDVAEVAGPAGDLASRAFQAAGKLIAGEPLAAATVMSPVAAQNLAKAIEMASTGKYTDRAGKKVLDVDSSDAASKAIGFQPREVARVQRADSQAAGMIQLNKLRESEIADAWAKGISDKDTNAIASARADLAAWNKANPESPIRITMQQLRQRVQTLNMDRATRLERTSPKEIGAEVRRQLETVR